MNDEKKIGFPIHLPGWLEEIIGHNHIPKLELTQFSTFLSQQKLIKISLEGLPGGGKSSILKHFKQYKSVDCFDQFETSIDHASPSQVQYIRNDIVKSHLAQASKKRFVLSDRDFLSTLAFLYATSSINKDHAYEILNEYYTMLLGRDLVLADIYIYLKVPRDQALIRKNRIANSESAWCNLDFLNRMSDFYDQVFDKLKHLSFVIEIDTNSTSLSQAIAKITNIIKSI